MEQVVTSGGEGTAKPKAQAGRRDLTVGPIWSTLLTFGLPTLGSNILQSLNGSINSIWIGQFLGESALAATSNAGMILFLSFAAVFGFGMASTILIGQAIGRHDLSGARRAFGSSVGMVMIAALLISTLGWIFTPQIIDIMATPGDARALAIDYLRVTFFGVPAVMMLALLGMALRGMGDSMSPLWFMIVSAVLDCALNPVFILGLGPIPAMGISGSALATVIANVTACAGLVAYIYVRDLAIRLRGHELAWLRPQRDIVRVLITKGVPIATQTIVMTTASLTMIGLVNREGVATAAAYAVTQQLWTYIQMPAMAISVAVSTMCAQNIGAGKWDRVSATTRAGMICTTTITLCVITLILLFDRPVMSIFVGSDSPVIAIARRIQLIASWTYVFFGCTMMIFAVMRANGATLMPLIILAISLYPVRVAFAVYGQSWLGADALWVSYPLGAAVSLLLAGIYYRNGAWRKATMGLPPDPVEIEEEVQATSEPAGRMHPNT